MKLTKDTLIEGVIVKKGTSIELVEKTTKDVDISTISVGDTVEHNGKEMTVGKNDIKNDGFMGTTLFGDSYSLGHKKVKKILSESKVKEGTSKVTESLVPITKDMFIDELLAEGSFFSVSLSNYKSKLITTLDSGRILLDFGLKFKSKESEIVLEAGKFLDGAKLYKDETAMSGYTAYIANKDGNDLTVFV